MNTEDLVLFQDLLCRATVALEEQVELLRLQYDMNLEIREERRAMTERMEQQDAVMQQLILRAEQGNLDG